MLLKKNQMNFLWLKNTLKAMPLLEKEQRLPLANQLFFQECIQAHLAIFQDTNTGRDTTHIMREVMKLGQMTIESQLLEKT